MVFCVFLVRSRKFLRFQRFLYACRGSMIRMCLLPPRHSASEFDDGAIVFIILGGLGTGGALQVPCHGVSVESCCRATLGR